MSGSPSLLLRVGKSFASPGPAFESANPNYYKPRAPAWTLKSRPRDHIDDPGPGYVNLPSTLICAVPSLNQSRVHVRDLPSRETPGPGYLPPPFGTEGRGALMKSGHSPRLPRNDSPGPAYETRPPFGSDARASACHGRNAPSPATASPGPAYNPDYRATHRGPAATLHGRPPDPRIDATPGPYSVRRDRGGRSIVIGSKLPQRNSTVGPGPAYRV
jgi:hypothetical protein